MMRTNHVKEKLKRGEPSPGAWLSFPSVHVARIMARLNFDWLVVDMEHSAYTPVLMADIVATIADSGSCVPLVRVPTNSVEWFKWALDAGAWGVVVPMVNSGAEAQQVIEYTKYPPRGSRSIGGAFGPYGFGITDWSRYAQGANDEILVAVQIESRQGLENVDEILATPDLDVAFIGPNDLHAQLGLPASNEGAEPEFVDAVQRILAAARQHHVATGIFCSSGKAAAERIQQGFQMVSVTTDISSMIEAAVQHVRDVHGS